MFYFLLVLLFDTEATLSYAGPFGGQHTGHGLVVRGTHRLSLDVPKDAAKAWRPLADRTYLQPELVFGAGSSSGSSSGSSASASSASVATNTASFVNALPVNVQLMTLQALSQTTLLVRLSHQFGLGEDATLSLPVTVDVVQLFKASTFDIASVEEVSLTNTQSKQELLKRRALNRGWKTEVPAEAMHVWRNATLHEGSVTLGPLEIKTFVVTLK
jgi:hypothetical protein